MKAFEGTVHSKYNPVFYEIRDVIDVPLWQSGNDLSGRKTMNTMKLQKNNVENDFNLKLQKKNSRKSNSHHVGRYRKTHAGCILGVLSL